MMPRQDGVLHRVDRDRLEACLDDHRVVGQRSVHELRRGPVRLELSPGLDEVDGCDIEEEANARRGVGQLAVDRQVARSQLAGRGHATSVRLVQL